MRQIGFSPPHWPGRRRTASPSGNGLVLRGLTATETQISLGASHHLLGLRRPLDVTDASLEGVTNGLHSADLQPTLSAAFCLLLTIAIARHAARDESPGRRATMQLGPTDLSDRRCLVVVGAKDQWQSKPVTVTQPQLSISSAKAAPLGESGGAHRTDAIPPDLGGEHRAGPVPPISHSLVVDLDAALVQEILDVTQRERKADVEHRRQTDDLWARFENTKGGTFGDASVLTKCTALLQAKLKPSRRPQFIRTVYRAILNSQRNLASVPWKSVGIAMR